MGTIDNRVALVTGLRGHDSDEGWDTAEAYIQTGHARIPKTVASAVILRIKDEDIDTTGQTIHVDGAWLNGRQNNRSKVQGFKVQ